jgi:hypothetical protein
VAYPSLCSCGANIALQIILIQPVVLLSLMITVRWIPWRVGFANPLDIFFTSSMLFILALTAFGSGSVDRVELARVWAIALLTMLATAPWAIAYALYENIESTRKSFDFSHVIMRLAQVLLHAC